MTATVPDLLAAVGPATDFADAACIGRWAWFDPPNNHEPAASVQSRHEAAVHLCGTCPIPVVARCAALARSLPKAGRHGVWAGRSFDSASNPQVDHPTMLRSPSCKTCSAGW